MTKLVDRGKLKELAVRGPRVGTPGRHDIPTRRLAAAIRQNHEGAASVKQIKAAFEQSGVGHPRDPAQQSSVRRRRRCTGFYCTENRSRTIQIEPNA
jgi:hypothetical protein